MNTKSSSETELVGVDNLLPTVLWTKYFIKAQGYNVEHSIIHQDNEFTLRMLINGKKSCTPQSKHIRAKKIGKRLLRQRRQYINATIHMELTLGVDSLNNLNWFIDSAHQVHEDCKWHTGEELTLGQGAVISKSSGQKMNTKSSSETELVGVDNLLPTVLWTKYFIKAQGYNVEHSIIHQDNEFTLRMLINGKKSCTPQSKHIRAKKIGKILLRQRRI